MQTIELRPYQHDTVGEVYQYRNQLDEQGNNLYNRVIACGPTGCGKTVMFSYLVQQELQHSFDKKALILTHRKELLTQAGGSLLKFGIRYEVINAESRKINHRARCYVAMVETLAKRVQKMPWLLDVDLIIIDECHMGSFKKLFSQFRKETFVIGFTATPIAASKHDPLSNYYQALINRIQIQDLIDTGFLMPCVTYIADVDKSKLKKDKYGEYSEQSQLDTFAKRAVYAGLVKRYKEVCDRYNEGRPIKTVCFNVNIPHSIEVTQAFIDAGYRAVHLDSETDDKERDRIIKAYIAGEYDIINNIGILNAGFDDPPTTCVIVNRATSSVSFWLQSCGRGSRPSPGKQRFIVIDMGDNWRELDPWDAVRDWSSIWNQKVRKSDKKGVAPVKECPNEDCGALVALTKTVCPECGEVFPVKEKEFAEVEQFVELTSAMIAPKLSNADKALLRMNTRENWQRMPVDMLLRLAELKDWSIKWVARTINERSATDGDFLEDLQALANLKEYNPRWIQHQVKIYRPSMMESVPV